MKFIGILLALFSVQAMAAPTWFDVEFTKSEYQCARHVVDYLVREDVIKGKCRYQNSGNVHCRLRKGAAASPWLWQKAKYKTLEGSEDLRILMDSRYEDDALNVFWDLRDFLDCQECTRKVSKDCFCANPISNFKSLDGRFELIFCFTLDIYEKPSCKKTCKPVHPEYGKLLIPNVELRLSQRKTCEPITPAPVEPSPAQQQVPVQQVPSKIER